MYNHWDSYPSGLGKDLIEQLIRLLEKYTIDELVELIDNLKIVNDDITPTEEEIEKLKKYSDIGTMMNGKLFVKLGTGKLTDWYCLLRKCQGSIETVIESGYAHAVSHPNMADAIEYSENSWTEFYYTLDFVNDEFSCNDEVVCSMSNPHTNWIN